MADENGEPAEHRTFHVGQEPVAPVERGLHGLLARRRRARPLPQPRQTFVEQRGGLLQPVGFNAPGRELDRKRHTVKLPADVCDNGRFRIAENQARTARDRALHEQLGCRKLLDRRRSEPRGVRRTRKRIEPVDALTFDPQRLTARGQDVDLRRSLDEACRERGHRFHQMFAGVEDQKNPPALQ
jgi:hypothetical protein